MAFTRSRFAEVCQQFVSKQSEANNQNEFLCRGSRGWKWKGHSTLSNSGYLQRIGYTSRLQKLRSDLAYEFTIEDGPLGVTEDEDESIAILDGPETLLSVEQHVAFSPTFQTPVFYFIIYAKDGSPLPLSEIMQTSFLRRDALPSDTEVASHGISFQNSNFPILSLGDHPVLTEPYWYLHPCQSSAAVDELLQTIPQPHGQDPLLTWLETWFLVLKSIVDIR